MNDFAEPADYDLMWLKIEMGYTGLEPTEAQEDYFIERVAMLLQDIDNPGVEATEEARMSAYTSMIYNKIS